MATAVSDERATELAAIAQEIRFNIVDMVYHAQSGHISPGLGSADIMATLFFHTMPLDPLDPKMPDRDRFVLSKGHSCPVLYATLALRGYFPIEELKTLRQMGSRLQGHPVAGYLPGVEVTTGSLGMGASQAVGMALEGRMLHQDYKIWALLGDGEINEGLIWEAAMAAAKYKLGNLVFIVDRNNLQTDGTCDVVMPTEPIDKKFEAFNWKVWKLDGHDIPSVMATLEAARDYREGPVCVIAKTIKGKGVSFMENTTEWHAKPPNDEQYARAVAELRGGPAVSLVKAKNATRRAFGERVLERGEDDQDFVVFESDLGKSSQSNLFGDKYPDRYFNLGIAELNTMAAAAGMAANGRTAFVAGYSVFLTMRALEAVRSFICYPKLNVKIYASHGGLTAAIDGVTHQGSEDIAFMTSIPNMKVLVPADSVAARAACDLALATPGPVFVRLMRDPLYEFYQPGETFRIGGSKIVRKGKDITLASYGDIVFQAIQAADALAEKGIEAEVLDLYSVKPVDTGTVLESVRRTGALVVAENHQQRNGLGYEVAAMLLKQEPVPFDNLGLEDRFAESGNYFAMIDKYGFSAARIAAAAERLLLKSGKCRDRCIEAPASI